jgi:hypothetical protein
MLPQLTAEAVAVLEVVRSRDRVGYNEMLGAISGTQRPELDARALWVLYLLCASDAAPDLEIHARLQSFIISEEAALRLGEIAAVDQERAALLLCRALATDHGSMELDLLERLIAETSQ